MKFHKTTLDNGLTIIAELNPSVFSVAMQVSVKAGARDESDELSGVSHFLEHMTFKGTEKFSAEDVNRIIDDLGADSNASTGDEVTEYHVVCLPEHIPVSFEVLADIIYPSLRQDDFDTEKNVILEEISMYQDMPAWVAYINAMEAHFHGHPLGNPVLGTTQSVTDLTRDAMHAYHTERYKTGNMVLSVAGNADWEQIVSLANQFCSHWPSGTVERNLSDPHPPGSTKVFTKDGSLQEHIFQIASAPSAHSKLRFAADMLAVIIGDDSGSRMYWEILDAGLADAADLGYYEYDNYGAWMTYLSCQPEAVSDNLKRIADIYADVNENGVTEQELEQAKNKVASRVVLRSERPMGRLRSLTGNWLYREEYRSVEDDLLTLQTTTSDDIKELLKTYPLAQTTTSAFGPLSSLNGSH